MIADARPSRVKDWRDPEHETIANRVSRAEFDPEILREMETDVGRRSFEKLVNACIDDIRIRLERLMDASVASDCEASRLTAHQVLGIFAHFGALGAANAARAVVDAPANELAARLVDLREISERAVGELCRIMNDESRHRSDSSKDNR
ncbi:MAG: hypothetical protein WB816_03680 [Methylocystis sp.]